MLAFRPTAKSGGGRVPAIAERGEVVDELADQKREVSPFSSA